MNNAQKPSNSECYTPSSELFRFYKEFNSFNEISFKASTLPSLLKRDITVLFPII
jgi:hypothetical protein